MPQSENADTTDSSPPDRENRERVYREVLRVVEATADERPGISAHELWTNRVQAGIGMSAVRSAVRAAREHGDLLRIHDPDGKVRYVRAESGTLREAVAWVAGWDEPDRELIGRLNAALERTSTGDPGS